MSITPNLNWKSYSVSQTTTRIPGQSSHKTGSKVSCKKRQNRPYSYAAVTSFHSRKSFDNERGANTRKSWTQIKRDGDKINNSPPRMNTPTHSKQLPIPSSDRHNQSSQPLKPPTIQCPPAGMQLGAHNTNTPSVRNGNTISGCCEDGLTVPRGCWWSKHDNHPSIHFN